MSERESSRASPNLKFIPGVFFQNGRDSAEFLKNLFYSKGVQMKKSVRLLSYTTSLASIRSIERSNFLLDCTDVKNFILQKSLIFERQLALVKTEISFVRFAQEFKIKPPWF